MTDPIQIMDELHEISVGIPSTAPIGHNIAVTSDGWQSLRTALEAQAEREAQKDARIARLEGAIGKYDTLAIDSVEIHEALNESPAQSAERKPNQRLFAVDVLGDPMREREPGKWENCIWKSDAAHLKAEVLRDEAWQWREAGDSVVKDYPDTDRDKLVHFFIADQLQSKADRIEREAKESDGR